MTLAVKYERLLRSKVTSPSPELNQLYILVIDKLQQRREEAKKGNKNYTFYYSLAQNIFIYVPTIGSPDGPALAKFALDRFRLRLFRSLWIPSRDPRCSVGKSHSGCGLPLSGDVPFNSFRRIPENPSSRIYEGIFNFTSDTCTTRRGTVCPSKDYK